DGELESDFPPVDFRHTDFYFYFQSQRRRRQMINGHVRTDRILTRVDVLHQPVAAGVLDVAHHARRRVDHAFLAHEADAARFVDGDLLAEREARLEGSFHARE